MQDDQPHFAHINFGVVSRSSRGGHAVKAAAYQACARLSSGSTEYDFTRKAAEHVAGGLLLPTGAPASFADAGTLWRAAEAAEKRVDAQVARQVVISLPRECPPERREAMAKEIAAGWVEAGMAVQYDLHNPPAADGGEQPHAHFLLALRRLGSGGFDTKKERDWNALFRDGNGKVERQRIANSMNEFMQEHHILAHVDPRSFAAQGVDQPREPHAPRAEWEAFKKTGKATERVAEVLAHRTKRAELAKVEADTEEAAAEVEALAREVKRQARPAVRADHGKEGGRQAGAWHAALLQGHYPAADRLGELGRHAWVDKTAGTATLRVEGGGRLQDDGERVEWDGRGDLTKAAVATLTAAEAHGWQKLEVTGAAAWREAVTLAAALRVPPITTDHTLSRAGQKKVEALLKERAAATDQARAKAEKESQPARPPEEAKAAAFRFLAAQEQAAGTDPARLGHAREVTRAAVNGDRATLEAATRGDKAAADHAAAEWLKRQEEERKKAAEARGRVLQPAAKKMFRPR